jgi:HAD superfamily hydrolase (TIGR01548 family)
MDGVLVDVSESYRAAIRSTVEHFTGIVVPNELVQEFKNRGGFNDDWALCFELIQDAGVDTSLHAVISQFQKFFRGENGEAGLIQRERWMARDGLFDRLASQYRLAVFTGRLREEAGVTLRRFAPSLFDPVVCTDDVIEPKPHPEGLLKIRAGVPHRRIFYMGDTVDDAQSARAAQVPFIGIVGNSTPRRSETIDVLKDHGAIAVLSSINELEEVL